MRSSVAKLALCALLAVVALMTQGCFEEGKEKTYGYLGQVKDEIVKAACSEKVQDALADIKSGAKSALDEACGKLEGEVGNACKLDGEARLESESQKDAVELESNCIDQWNQRFGGVVDAVSGVADWVKSFMDEHKEEIDKFKANMGEIVSDIAKKAKENSHYFVGEAKDEIIKAACSEQVQSAVESIKNKAKTGLETACNKLAETEVDVCKADGEAKLKTKAKEDKAEMQEDCIEKLNKEFDSVIGTLTGVADWVKNFVSDNGPKLAEFKEDFDDIIAKAADVKEKAETLSANASHVKDKTSTLTSRLFEAGGLVTVPGDARKQITLAALVAMATFSAVTVALGVRAVCVRAAVGAGSGADDIEELLDDSHHNIE